MDGQTPKKQRRQEVTELSPAGSTPSPAVAQQAQAQAQAQNWAAQAQQTSQLAAQEAGDSTEAVRGGAAVTDAAKAFRELRVRAPRAASPRRHAGAGGGGAGQPERPSSPKKRKASFNIDTEPTIDKGPKHTQGDISQARGQLGQLLFEFSQIELNRDLLEAIKRTESKTGRSSGRAPPAPDRLDRAAFELAVADAAELLLQQLGSVEAHCEDGAVRRAILRSYAVQAIAAFADEDSDSEESGAGNGAGSSSDEENADSNSRGQLRGGSSSQEEQAGRGPLLASLSGQLYDVPARPGSAAGCHSPQRMPSHLQQHGQQQGQEGRGEEQPGSMFASPQRSQPAGSAAGQAGSSSFLPDAPPDSALEDTATACSPLQQQGEEGPERRRAGSAAPVAEAGTSRFAWQPPQGRRPADDGPLQRMQMLSLEAEGSALQGQSGEEGEEDGPQDMIRSPAPVTSRRVLPDAPPAMAAFSQAQAESGAAGAGALAAALEGPQEQGREWGGPGTGGTRRSAAAAASGGRVATALGEAAQVAQSTRPQEQQRRQGQQGQQPLQEQEQQQESSEGHSTGQASSAAPEPPKRQRRSGDALPPLFEHSSRRRQHNQRQQKQAAAAAAATAAAATAAAAAGAATSPGSDVQAAAAAAQRAAILGSLQRPQGGEGPPQQEPQVPQQAERADLAPAGPQAEGALGPPAQGQQQQQQQQQGQAEPGGAAPEGAASDAALRAPLHAAHSGSSVWGSTLVCADLTVNDVASQYWPFLRTAMRGQAATLQAGDTALVESMVQTLGETITDAYVAAASSTRRPTAEVKSLVAATAFDDFFRALNAGAESSAASLG